MIKTTLFAAAFALAGLAAPAQAQFLNMDLNASNAAFNARLNAAMASIQRRDIADPRVMAAWRSGACGRGLSAQQVAYVYAVTAGCTPQGLASYLQNQARDNGHDIETLDHDQTPHWRYVYRPDSGWVRYH